ncbi:hypothetical protein V8E54_002424 [Elaphomyces granulatus]
MDVLGSMEWQLGLDSRGRHLAKAAGISTSGDNQWYMTAQWRNRTDEWSTEDGVMAILHIISGWQYDAEGIQQKRLVTGLQGSFDNFTGINNLIGLEWPVQGPSEDHWTLLGIIDLIGLEWPAHCRDHPRKIGLLDLRKAR